MNILHWPTGKKRRVCGAYRWHGIKYLQLSQVITIDGRQVYQVRSDECLTVQRAVVGT